MVVLRMLFNAKSTRALFFLLLSWVPILVFIYTSMTFHQKARNATQPTTRVQACVHPTLQLGDPAILRSTYTVKAPICTSTDLVQVTNGTVQLLTDRECDYTPIHRVNDDKIHYGKVVKNIPDGFRISTDFFKIYCDRKTEYHASAAFKNELWKRKEADLRDGFGGLGIAMLGFDSVSRMAWLRQMPKTRNYFLQLGAIELQSHNIVGDGTTAVFLPMLTGKFEWELPECRRKFNNAKYMDKFPFLWHPFKDAGYLTSWCNGDPTAAPFNYRMLGFNHQPTDFYTRPFYLAMNKRRQYQNYCIGSVLASRVWLNYFRDIFTVYYKKRKFLIHFLVEMSHDNNNLLNQMDADLRDLIEFLNNGDYLNNTVLVLMGDHGARYHQVRYTWQGKMEERLPYFSFLFPKWFEEKYPEAIQNLRTNTRRLTTPFDIHETLKDFLHFDGTGVGNVSKRGISLFKEIPLERTCEHAKIAPHWCACLDWKKVSFKDKKVKRALSVALKTINGFTQRYRKECALLSVQSIDAAVTYETRKEILKFLHTDTNGGIYKVNLTHNGQNELALYQLTFTTSPGGGQFEVTVTNDIARKQYHLPEDQISRINKYGDDPKCILEKNRQLRAYCYCNNTNQTESAV
ncbi:uncharacterized protein LOC131956642 [Physella acuta]|uniref:uncharacterized protein LOC131956642 n=1 Tax=Physella acuta TaxID=109671 RepID=UPI0027DE605B|nr:uncharacterized protein LOC131956642 [Physella acuta]XP_059177155.1 uncharacterized protein LOC131956642 [Physella acuta]